MLLDHEAQPFFAKNVASAGFAPLFKAPVSIGSHVSENWFHFWNHSKAQPMAMQQYASIQPQSLTRLRPRSCDDLNTQKEAAPVARHPFAMHTYKDASVS
jgi:hypothetical protein